MGGYELTEGRVIVCSISYDRLGRRIEQSEEYAIRPRGNLEKIGLTEVVVRDGLLFGSRVGNPHSFEIE